jgi:hypothetical protein
VSFSSGQSEDFLYCTNNGTITITGYIGPGGDVAIPKTIYGLPVATIRDLAFYACTNLSFGGPDWTNHPKRFYRLRSP